MNNFYYLDEDYLLNLKPNYFRIKIVWVIIIIILIFGSFEIRVGNIFTAKMQFYCNQKCYIEGEIPQNIVSQINENDKIFIDNQNISFNNIKINNNLINYELNDNDLTKEKIYDVQIKYNKERLFNKFINYLFK
jgi:hypothetical protein